MAGQEALERALAVLASSRRDDKAWAVVYREIWPGLIAQCRRREATIDDAQDLAHEVLMRVARYARLDTLRTARSFRAYVGVAVRNTATTRRGRRSDIVETELVGDPSPSAFEGALVSELWELLCRGLVAEEEELLALARDGFTTPDIAKRLGLSYGAAAARLFRLRQKIRNVLEDEGLQVPGGDRAGRAERKRGGGA